MKFTQPFKGLVDGDKYERDFFAGEECPKNLEADAIKAGAVDDGKKTAEKSAPKMQTALSKFDEQMDRAEPRPDNAPKAKGDE